MRGNNMRWELKEDYEVTYFHYTYISWYVSVLNEKIGVKLENSS